MNCDIRIEDRTGCTIRAFSLYLVLATLSSHTTALAFESEQFDRSRVNQLGAQQHLFIDDTGVSRMHNVSFNVNPPYVRGVVLRGEHDWEAPTAYSSVLDDGGGVYKLYYMNGSGRRNICLATS